MELASPEVHINTMQGQSNTEVETSVSRSDKRSRGKVQTKVHKAEREKMKREHLNGLFLDLANSLGLSEQPNGKASVLNDATRMIKDMVSQIEHLRNENTALTTEAQDVTAEKKELQDENFTLGSLITELQNDIEKRKSESQVVLNAAPVEMQYHELVQHSMNEPLLHPAPESTLQVQNMNTIYVIPYPGISTAPSTSQAVSNHSVSTTVRKPYARYPSPGDAWPSQILEKNPE